MQDVAHGAIRNPVDSSWIHAFHMEADLHVGQLCPGSSLFCLQVPLIINIFAGLNSFRVLLIAVFKDLSPASVRLLILAALFPTKAVPATKLGTFTIATAVRVAGSDCLPEALPALYLM